LDLMSSPTLYYNYFPSNAREYTNTSRSWFSFCISTPGKSLDSFVAI
jgi:hypothetical protein